ncbi:MAG: hypothetical protein ACJAT0_002457 [Nonlabens sp.]|uniref:hypothetical protein n=1 Tax=Nonlabens sp. TaxID=1888209 RepID=UPI0039E5D6FA
MRQANKVVVYEFLVSVDYLYKLAEILETKVGDLLEVNPSNVYHQNNNDQGTFVGHQEVQNLYEDNKEKTQTIIQLYEAGLKDKDALIEELRRK